VLAAAIVHIAEMGDADGHARPARRQQKEAAEQMEMGVHNVILLLGQKAPKVNEAAEQIALKRRMIHLPAQGGDLLFQRFGIAFRREKVEPDGMLLLQAGVNFYRAYLRAASLQRSKDMENTFAVH